MVSSRGRRDRRHEPQRNFPSDKDARRLPPPPVATAVVAGEPDFPSFDDSVFPVDEFNRK